MPGGLAGANNGRVTSTERDKELVRELAAVVGDANVLVDRDLVARFETDWTGRFRGEARCVVRPGTTEETAAVVALCSRAGVPLVPQGGNTGLVGGGVPRGGDVVLSLTRLNALEPVDAVAGHVTVGAGVTLAQLQEQAREAGFIYGVDLASRDSATVGGMVATNAGGLHVLRYGPTRAQLVGLEVVLASGEVVSRMSGLEKDNTGYDLPGLFTGSEGTLGVVTRARLRLHPPEPQRVTALLAMDNTAAALALLGRLRQSVRTLDAIEAFFEEGVELVCEHTGASRPFPARAGCYLLIECAGAADPLPGLLEALEGAEGIGDSAVATDGAQRRALWQYREAHTIAINAEGVPHKLDVTLPLGRLAAFEAEVRQRVAEAAPGARSILFGHLGDGNLHVNVLGLEPEDDRATDAVLRLVASMGGSISAEHGIGVAKAPWLHLTRSTADIAAMRAIKRALDPGNILNRGVIFGLD
ncbi:MAG: FAD-binding oxidoreductase [Dehalococcoidia bacterium]